MCSLLVGDTLFALGCGRMFEGNAQQMWTSLSKMKPLPPATKVFCAHEYTQSNAKFALSIDPDNQALQKRAALINDLRKQVLPHVQRFLSNEATTASKNAVERFLFLAVLSLVCRGELGIRQRLPVHLVFVYNTVSLLSGTVTWLRCTL